MKSSDIEQSKNQPKMVFKSKGWGFEKWIVNNEKYCGKILYFVKGQACSLHYHKNKEEDFYVHSGKIALYYTDDIELFNEFNERKGGSGKGYRDFLECVVLGPGDNFHIPPGRAHQMRALQDTELFEFSTHHEESDSYRLIKGD